MLDHAFHRLFYYSKTILFSYTQLLLNQWNHRVCHLLHYLATDLMSG